MENGKISMDLLIEILTRLPVRSLMRFKCVCKLFYFFITSDHHFKHKHYEISRSRSDYVIFQHGIGVWPCQSRYETVVGLVYKEIDSDEIGCVNLPIPISLVRDIKCVDGMLCLVTSIDDPEGVYEMIWCILIWNPSTSEIKELPYMKPHDILNPRYEAIGFGLSSYMTGKVVMIWVYPDPIAMVCSQDDNSWSWRRVSIFFHIIYVDNRSDFYLKGKYYWSCMFRRHDQKYLVWLDFDDEKFGKIELPRMNSWASISAMNNTIALVSYRTNENQIEIWTMNGHNNIIGWHKYASVDTGYYCLPMKIWNVGRYLLVCSQEELELLGTEDDGDVGYVKPLVSYDIETQEKKIIYVQCLYCSRNPLLVYSESLKSF